MHPILYDTYNAILHLILPVRCVVCKKEYERAVCESCLALMPQAKEQQCIACHKPSIAGLTHLPCQRSNTMDQLLSLYSYKNEVVSEFIITGKYKFVPDAFREVAPKLGRLIEDHAEVNTKTIVTPLPLHTFRERWRGFNQAALLGQGIATYLHIPQDLLLYRNRATKTQKDLHRNERLINMANCFSILPEVNVKDKTIILVDDVTTSGTTLQEAAQVLKQNGAAKIIGVTLAQD